MENGDGLDRLFFELASESRLRILQELEAKQFRMQELARKLHLTVTETCRQLQRLTEASLIEKQPNATYKLTPYAKLVLDVSSSLNFISKYKEYFLNHNATLLPVEFRARLGELTECALLTTTMESINKVTEEFWAAESRIDVVIQGGPALIEILRQRSLAGVKIRWLMQESFIPQAPSVLASWKQPPEIRTTTKPIGYMLVTDKAANFTIRYNDGAMSYTSFHGKNASFMKWVNDLWMYEWERAKPWRA